MTASTVNFHPLKRSLKSETQPNFFCCFDALQLASNKQRLLLQAWTTYIVSESRHVPWKAEPVLERLVVYLRDDFSGPKSGV